MKNVKNNIENIKNHLIKKSVQTNWSILEYYLHHLDFECVLSDLYNETTLGYGFTPKLKHVFNAFYKCPIDKFKVLIVGQDPYPQHGVADGIAFSCSNTMKEQPSLKYIFDELQNKIDPNYQRDPDLSRWSKQGVLLLNTSLTCRVNQIGSHYHIWKNFIEYLFDNFNKHNKDVAVIFLGAKAKEWKNKLNNLKQFTASHPASAAYNGGAWESEDVFNNVNDYLKSLGKEGINW